MKQLFTHYIYILIFIIFSSNCFAQKITLKLASKNKSDLLILKKINYKITHLDSISVYSEINKISNNLKNTGYLTHTIDLIYKDGDKITAQYRLGTKIDSVKIRNKTKELLELLGLKKNTDSIIIGINKLQNTLNSISTKLEKKGASFSKIQLSNIKVNKHSLFADIKINKSNKREIDKTLIKGYELFPKSHIKHYFNIKKHTLFNQLKLKEVSNLSKSLKFVNEIKKPEVLFAKDSTLLYIYLKKQQNNSFDGLINFSTKENGGILFNGHLDLELNNIINTGEQFKLLWNRLNENKQEFQIATILPYIFNSPFTPSISFNIFTQDSTFLNTEFKSNLAYNINTKAKISLTYSKLRSNNLQQDIITNGIEGFENSFLGIKFRYLIPKNDFFRNNKLYFEINPAIGNRKTENSTLNQYQLKLTLSYIWNINKRNSISITNRTGYLKSNKYLKNELFRIGGPNSIRGFNEQSIYTRNFSLLNIEYRILTSPTSYLYTITDIARAKSNITYQDFMGIGIGYLFKTTNSQINLSTAIGKINSNKLNFGSSKVIISWKNYF